MPPEVRVCIGGWSWVWHPYIEHSLIDDEEIARTSGFCRLAEIYFHHLSGPRNVTVDLKYDVLCLQEFM